MAQVNTYTNIKKIPNRAAQLVVAVDSAANDSDKTITVPAGEVWELLSVYAKLATSADVGDRQIVAVVKPDGTNEGGRFQAADVQAASTTNYYQWGISGDSLETIATLHTLPFAPRYLPAGATIQIVDSAGIAAAADDLTIVVTALAQEA